MTCINSSVCLHFFTFSLEHSVEMSAKFSFSELKLVTDKLPLHLTCVDEYTSMYHAGLHI